MMFLWQMQRCCCECIHSEWRLRFMSVQIGYLPAQLAFVRAGSGRRTHARARPCCEDCGQQERIAAALDFSARRIGEKAIKHSVQRDPNNARGDRPTQSLMHDLHLPSAAPPSSSLGAGVRMLDGSGAISQISASGVPSSRKFLDSDEGTLPPGASTSVTLVFYPGIEGSALPVLDYTLRFYSGRGQTGVIRSVEARSADGHGCGRPPICLRENAQRRSRASRRRVLRQIIVDLQPGQFVLHPNVRRGRDRPWILERDQCEVDLG
jgi:hypothetical protein